MSNTTMELEFPLEMIQVGIDTREVVRRFQASDPGCRPERKVLDKYKLEEPPLRPIEIDTVCRRTIVLTIEWTQCTDEHGKKLLDATPRLGFRVEEDKFVGSVNTAEAYINLAGTIARLREALQQGFGVSCRTFAQEAELPALADSSESLESVKLPVRVDPLKNWPPVSVDVTFKSKPQYAIEVLVGPVIVWLSQSVDATRVGVHKGARVMELTGTNGETHTALLWALHESIKDNVAAGLDPWTTKRERKA